MTEARMQETTHFAPGTFCWVELGTTKGEAAKKFYTSLFGWDYVDNPVGPDMVYTMLQLDGKDVGALFQLPGEMLSKSLWRRVRTVARSISRTWRMKFARLLAGRRVAAVVMRNILLLRAMERSVKRAMERSSKWPDATIMSHNK